LSVSEKTKDIQNSSKCLRSGGSAGVYYEKALLS